MHKLRLWFLIFIFLLILPIFVYAQPYLCGSTGLRYSDQNFCNSACGDNCQELTPVSDGTSYACPASGYEGFVYNPNTGYTYAVTTNTGFWTSFNAQSNNPSLAIISDTITNTALSQILTYYKIQSAWIGAYDFNMSTSYNTINSQNYLWWNNSAISYSNWSSGQPYNLLNPQDIGIVLTKGNHWAYMNDNGLWYADGYHYNYPASQNYAPYYNALVQWNGPLSCVNGVAPVSPPITQSDVSNTINQYCDGTTPCYMCTDTTQCIPQNLCPDNYTYNATNNDCEASYTCPPGGTLNLVNGVCEAQVSIACPNNYTYNATNNDCEAQASPSCNAGGSISDDKCVLTPIKGCDAYYTYNATNNDCEAYASAQCANGGVATIVNGQTVCQLLPTHSCADSFYVYNTLVAGQCAASANIQCPPGGSYSGGQCLSTASPCPTGYTRAGGLCTAPATITCPGLGTYSSIFGVCIEPVQNNCPDGFTLNPSTHYCESTPTSYICPGSGIYNVAESMCSTPVILSCPTGYSLVNNQCVSSINYNCPLPGSYNSVENACSTPVTSYNCPSGYTYTDNKCKASPSCPAPGTYNIAENACSAPLQPCSPTSQNMQQCIQTSMGYLCPLNNAECTPDSSNNNFTNGGVINPSAYNSSNWISTVGSNSINNGYMSFYNYSANLPAGTYTINFGTDDNGWLYINGGQINTSSGASWISNGGPAIFTIALMNNCPNCSVNSNPTGVYLSVVNSSGATVLTTNTNWQASLNPSNFGYSATCPSGFTWSKEYNACTANATITSYSCPPGGSYDGSTCTVAATPNYSCPSGYTLNGTTCTAAATPVYACPIGWALYGAVCVTSANPVQTCPSGFSFYWALYNGFYFLTCVNYSYPYFTGGWCPPPGIINGGLCQAPVIITYSCISGTLNGTNCTTNASVSYSCPPGGSYNGSICTTNATITSYSCPPGYTLNGTTCTAAATPNYSCTSGGYYSQDGNFCYIQPSISFGETCPLGNYQCMPNGNNGYSCSSSTCFEVNNANIQQEPVPVSTNPTNNGQVSDQGCEGSVYIFNGQTFDCREPGIENGFSNCCLSKKDWLGMGKCWQNEIELQQKKDAGFCHYIGTFCTAKFLGVCLQKVRAYCCFQGVLARIIQEQGRLQGLPQFGWGDPKSPNCIGFTPTQFQQLDWSKIDLTEYYVYIQQQFIPTMQQNVNNAVNNAATKLEQGYSW